MIVIIMPHFYSVNRFQITGTNKERTRKEQVTGHILQSYWETHFRIVIDTRRCEHHHYRTGGWK